MNMYTPNHVASLLGTLVSFTGTLKYQCLKRRNLRVVGKEKKDDKGDVAGCLPFWGFHTGIPLCPALAAPEHQALGWAL